MEVFRARRSGNVIHLMGIEEISFMAAVKKLLNYMIYECKIYK